MITSDTNDNVASPALWPRPCEANGPECRARRAVRGGGPLGPVGRTRHRARGAGALAHRARPRVRRGGRRCRSTTSTMPTTSTTRARKAEGRACALRRRVVDVVDVVDVVGSSKGDAEVRPSPTRASLPSRDDAAGGRIPHPTALQKPLPGTDAFSPVCAPAGHLL